ncbi:hypothetical protein SAMIE_1023670 [Sphingobium amiense]|uniref:Uncharacterized protein n=1 Tax=Sphingobium amiense TaxID=135719 RepID=A0A494W6B4_9SPHN|nr:hypothetical protein [Sphingobium amiense]BBD98866.1 hypothetical protein SAMIE_1023670 [Sphingobium amiense]
MAPNSPHYQFDPSSIGWLHRKVALQRQGRESGVFVTAADLKRIAEADPSVFTDPVFQEQIRLALEDRLPTRTGRLPADPVLWFRTLMADILIEDLAEEIRAERRAGGRKRLRGDWEPRVEAAEKISADLCMHMTGRSLLNRISAQKRG